MKVIGVCLILVVAVAMLIGVPLLRTGCRVDATQATLSAIAFASQQFNAKSNAWPTSLTELTRDPPYVIFKSQPPADAWGNPFLYMPYNSNAGCGLVVSWGADGKPGGTKQDRDRVMPFK